MNQNNPPKSHADWLKQAKEGDEKFRYLAEATERAQKVVAEQSEIIKQQTERINILINQRTLLLKMIQTHFHKEDQTVAMPADLVTFQ